MQNDRRASEDQPAIEFRPVTMSDVPMLANWMGRPHWQLWWGDPETELGFVIDMIEGRDQSRPFIFTADEVPAGYIQYWFVGLHQTPQWLSDNPWLAELPSEAVGVDISIADETALAKGLGSRTLRLFAEKLVKQGCQTIIIDPDPDNYRAVRAYQKAGFSPVPHLHGRTDGALIMQFQLNGQAK